MKDSKKETMIDSGSLCWRPSNLMKIPNADFLERTESEMLGARLWRLPPQSANTLHRHISSEEFFFVLEGIGRIRVDGRTYTVKQHEGIHVWPHQMRQVFNDTDEEVLWLITGSPDNEIPKGEQPDFSRFYPSDPKELPPELSDACWPPEKQGEQGEPQFLIDGLLMEGSGGNRKRPASLLTREEMNHAFEIHVSQRDADIALRRFIFRGAGSGTLIAAGLCFAYIAYDISDADIGPLGITILTLLAILVLVYMVGFVTRRRQMADLLRKLGDTPVSYRLDESEIATQSSLGSSTLKWEMIKKLWIDPDVTLVFYARNGFTTIPTAQIPVSALAFLSAQVERVGGSVLNNNIEAQVAAPNP